MAPFLVGDYIEYSGLKTANGEVLAWAITAINVQITTTASSTVPNYIRMEDALIGVFDTAANVEMADIRVSGCPNSLMETFNVLPVYWLPLKLCRCLGHNLCN
jgi:hypothetical protein